MKRICTSLAVNGFEVLLIGRQLRNSVPLSAQIFKQKRIRCFYNKGFLFYAEYNFRLFWWLLFQRMDAICAIDLDTIIPCLLISLLKSKQRIYDAHELFSEQKEVITRPFIHRFWLRIERWAVPKFKKGYTETELISNELTHSYKVN